MGVRGHSITQAVKRDSTCRSTCRESARHCRNTVDYRSELRRPARITWSEAAISPRSNGDAEISAEEHQEKKRKTDGGGWRAFPMPPLENAERAEKLHSGSGCVPVNSKPIKLFVRGSYSEFLTHNAFFRLSRMTFVVT